MSQDGIILDEDIQRQEQHDLLKMRADLEWQRKHAEAQDRAAIDRKFADISSKIALLPEVGQMH